eukprot:9535799-Alexandrium_andersonii.AAC.2
MRSVPGLKCCSTRALFYAKGVWEGGEPTVRAISWARNGGIVEAWGLAKAETCFDEALNAAKSPAGHTQ